MSELKFCAIDDLKYADVLYELELICFPDDPWSYDSFIVPFKSDISAVYAVKSGEAIIAYSIVNMIEDEAEILNFAVIPEMRKQGIGRMLLSGIIESCRNNGIENFYLEVRESNVPAIRLYESFGFEKYNFRKNYYRNPTENAVLMSLR